MTKSDLGLKAEYTARGGAGGNGATLIWAFAFFVMLVAIPALVVASLALVRMPDSSCPTLKVNSSTTSSETGHGESGGGHTSHWAYSGATGPENWATISDTYKACMGNRQSPINIKSNDAKTDASLGLSLSMFSDMGKLLVNDFQDLVSLTNNGHAVGVAGVGGYLTYQNTDYKLLQFHFHTPSEHRIDDTLYKAEVHLVHQSAAGKYLVVGVLIDEDVTDPPFWGADTFEKFPKTVEDSPVGNIKLPYTDLLSGLLAGDAPAPYWTYSGSFTTPPCTEEVTWVVVKQVAKMSTAHIGALQAVTGVNNRPVQPLNDRSVFTPA